MAATTGVRPLVSMANRTIWNTISGLTTFAMGYLTGVPIASGNATVTPDSTTGSGYCILGASTLGDNNSYPITVTVPWYSDVSFSYNPRQMAITGDHDCYNIIPTAEYLPGINITPYVIYTTLDTLQLEGAVYGADDYELLHLIPPPPTAFTTALAPLVDLKVTFPAVAPGQ